MEWLVVSKDGNTTWAEVTRKYDGLFTAGVIDDELNAGGADHVARFRPSGLNPGCDRNRFVVGNGAHASDDLFGVLDFVERILGRLARTLKPAILAFGVLRLNLRGVSKDECGDIHRGGSCEDRAAIAE